MIEKFEIKIISAEDTLNLRHRVLKPFLNKEQCRFQEDVLQSTFHHGLYLQKELIVVATMIKESHPEFEAQKPYRLRGMATATDYQHRGFGKQLLSAAINNLEEQGCDFLWFNARQIAFSFYQSLGFNFHGSLFEMEHIGPHKVMYKLLNPR